MLALSGAAVSLVVAACTGGDDTVSPTTSVSATTTTTIVRERDGVLKIGLYLPQTGPGAAIGEPMIAAVVDAIERINDEGGVLGSDVEWEIVDEGSSTGRAIQLLDAGVDAIIGPASSTHALSQLGTITQPGTGVVTCSPSATARSLDAYPDKGLFFRTVPSDSLQMAAIARRSERTGASTIAIGFLDDPYGRGLADDLVDVMESRNRQAIVAEVPFGADQEDLGPVAAELLADDPGVVVVLGDADDGGRLLTALGNAATAPLPQVIVNDSIRTATAIQQLSDEFRSQVIGVAPLATNDDVPGAFAPHAVDCVNLIALAVVEAGSDDPSVFRIRMAGVSGGGRQCTSFGTCTALLGERLQEERLQIDYNGLSGPIELSNTTGDPTRAVFVTFGFDADGIETDTTRFDVPS